MKVISEVDSVGGPLVSFLPGDNSTPGPSQAWLLGTGIPGESE